MITVLNGLCLVLSYSRGGLIGAVVALGSLVLLLVEWSKIRLPVRWQRWALPAVIGSALVGVIIALLVVEPLRLRVLSMFAGRNDTSNNYRINVWTAVLGMIHDFPILGIGPGNVAFNRVYPLYQLGDYSALGAYSVPLELTVEAGLLGSLTYFWMVIVLAVHGWRRWLQALPTRDPRGLWVAGGMAACLGMMAHGLVDTVWYRPQLQMLWWVGVALITSNLEPPIQEDPYPEDDSPKPFNA
jgi:putative inorganic carbon (HCO3(-)) transporter